MTMLRACFSGSAACTGIAPCDACAKAIFTRVLPKAMVAGGFNGSVDVAKRFFDAFTQASADLLEKAPHEMAEAMGAPAATQVPEEKPEPQPEEEEDKVDSGLTEDDVSAMGQITDTVDDAKVSLEPKYARSMARMARALKKKRALVTKKEQEGTHG